MNAPMVVDYEKDGQTVKGLVKPVAQRLPVLARAQFGRLDRLRRCDQLRRAGRVREHRSEDRGARLISDDHVPGTGKYAEFCPSLGRQGLAGAKPTTRTPA